MKNILIIQGPIESPGINGENWISQTAYNVSKLKYRQKFNSVSNIKKILETKFTEFTPYLAIYDHEIGFAKSFKCENLIKITSIPFHNDIE